MGGLSNLEGAIAGGVSTKGFSLEGFTLLVWARTLLVVHPKVYPGSPGAPGLGARFLGPEVGPLFLWGGLKKGGRILAAGYICPKVVNYWGPTRAHNKKGGG